MPGVKLVASGCDATTVTVEDGGGGAFVTVMVRLVLLVCPLLPVTVNLAVKLPALS
jgi:hypothetical protein